MMCAAVNYAADKSRIRCASAMQGAREGPAPAPPTSSDGSAMPKAINELKAKYEDDIGQLNKKIVELQLRLDDRERRRREHEEEVRVKNERINTIAGLIATGNVIAKSFEEKNDKDLVKEQYLEWERDALESLASGTFGVTYLAPFGSAKGTGMSLMNHKIPGVNASHSETVRRCPALNQRVHNGGAACLTRPLFSSPLFWSSLAVSSIGYRRYAAITRIRSVTERRSRSPHIPTGNERRPRPLREAVR
jgi:hypothetical protein